MRDTLGGGLDILWLVYQAPVSFRMSVMNLIGLGDPDDDLVSCVSCTSTEEPCTLLGRAMQT